MGNPWETISLSDYENHMSLYTVKQLQALNEMMRKQLNSYSADSVMILGIAGGNGLEHVDPRKYYAVYGVDINSGYLREVRRRYGDMDGRLKCICADLMTESRKLPNAELVIADLLIEYIGYERFVEVIKHVKPKYVSCGIQINNGNDFVSESPYIHSFDGLNSIHHQAEAFELTEFMRNIKYNKIYTAEHPLPNGKKLVQIDFMRKIPV